jgi:hypothetical protein
MWAWQGLRAVRTRLRQGSHQRTPPGRQALTLKLSHSHWPVAGQPQPGGPADVVTSSGGTDAHGVMYTQIHTVSLTPCCCRLAAPVQPASHRLVAPFRSWPGQRDATRYRECTRLMTPNPSLMLDQQWPPSRPHSHMQTNAMPYTSSLPEHSTRAGLGCT